MTINVGKSENELNARGKERDGRDNKSGKRNKSEMDAVRKERKEK